MKDQIVKYLTGIGVIAAMVVVVYLIYKFATKQPDFNAVPLPNEGTDPTDIRSITLRLHSDMEGFTLNRNLEVWTEFLELSDADFIAVYNDFGTMYYPESGQSLREWVDGETFAFNSSVFTPWSIYTGNEIKAGVIDRMDQLNLQ